MISSQMFAGGANLLDMGWEYQTIKPGDELPDLDSCPIMNIDVETKPKPEFMKRKKAGLDAHRSELLGIGVGVPGKSWYIPLRHRAPGSELFNCDPHSVYEWLKATIKHKKVIVNQNIKFDAKILKVDAGIDLVKDAPEAVFWDTMIASQLIDERWPTHSLKPVCEQVLGIPAVEARILDRFVKEAGQKKDYLDYSVVPADIMGKYGCKDNELPLRLMAWQLPQIERQNLMQAMKLEMRTLRTLINCETMGFRVDLERLALDGYAIAREALRLEEELHKEAGVSFNSNSAEELADVVATQFNLKVIKVWNAKDKCMKPKFDDVILQEYCHDYPERAPFFFKVRMVRRLQHLQSSFVDSYKYHNVNGIIYPNFMQLSPKSGTRMTSSDPNVQQVSAAKEWELPDNMVLPDKSEFSTCVVNKEGKRCWVAPGARQYFIPRDGHALLFFDQSQIEYRLFAHYANNPRMTKAYWDDPNLDLHEWMRVEILKGKIKRRPAKNVHFGIVYGMGKQKTVKSMQVSGAKITMAEGENILDEYHAQVPEVKELTWGPNGTAETLKRRGYLTSILGGRRRLAANWEKRKEDYDEDDEKEKGAKPYQGLNVVCQRSAMDVLKTTMNQADDAGYPLITPIHDELIYEPPREQFNEWALRLKSILQTFKKPDGTDYLRVPIYVQGKATFTRWSEAEELEFEEAKKA